MFKPNKLILIRLLNHYNNHIKSCCFSSYSRNHLSNDNGKFIKYQVLHSNLASGLLPRVEAEKSLQIKNVSKSSAIYLSQFGITNDRNEEIELATEHLVNGIYAEFEPQKNIMSSLQFCYNIQKHIGDQNQSVDQLIRKGIIDPQSHHRPIELPQLNNLNKEYLDPNKSIEIKLPTDFEKPSMLLKMKRKYNYNPRGYTHMTIIRRKKMKKHKLQKWRKKFKVLLEKLRLRKNIKKEKAFRAELLAQIKEAEEFDPEAYVKNILNTIDNMPKKETEEEIVKKRRDLIRKNRSDTIYTTPKFDD